MVLERRLMVMMCVLAGKGGQMRSLDVERTLGDLADVGDFMSASPSLYTMQDGTDCLRSGHARMGVGVK